MMLRRIGLLILVLALFAAAAPARFPSRATLSDLVAEAELIAIGRVVDRSGDPADFGFVRHAFEVQRVIAGDAPSTAPLLEGGYAATYDPDTGAVVGGRALSGSFPWGHDQVVLAFLRRIDGGDVWRAHPHGVRRLAPGDHDIYAQRITELLAVLRLPDSEERVDAMRGWALSLLDHDATLHDAAYELAVGAGSPREPPRLGVYSDEDRRRILEALLRNSDSYGYVARALIPLVEDVPSKDLDLVLAAFASALHDPPAGPRARYATLLAERLDDDELRELARILTELAASPHASSKDPAERGSWTIDVRDRGLAFRRAAFQSLQRFHR